jgi:iron-sulfur cluster protein
MEAEGEAISGSARGGNTLADHAIEEFESFEDRREEARAIKEDAIERLPELVDQVVEAVEENGGQVYLAQDAADANRYVEEVLDRRGAESLVKSKSMTTEEIELNEHLESVGVEVHETDLGEFVIQAAEEKPSHLIGPAMHKSTGEIADLFNRVFEPEEPLAADVEELTAFARERVGQHIREADAGMTGANFVAAESGTIALVTNEGNARKSAVTPDTHIAVTGVEKIVPTVEDLRPFAELIARTGTGQDITSYFSLLSPPVDTPIPDFETGELRDADEREFHLVLLDNGRMAMREDDELRETLYCIRCGACANSCSNFQSVGGHAFGGQTYTGGIGTGWEAGVHGLDSAAEMNDLCTGCTRCVNKCPTKVDIPWVNTVVRDRLNHDAEPDEFDFLVEGLTPDDEPVGMDVQKRFFGHIDTVAKVGSALAPVSNWVADSDLGKRLAERTVGVDTRRDLPEFASETLHDWMAARESLTDPDREVVLYPDVYTTYFDVERGKAAVRTLEALGCRVLVPAVPESGRAPLSQGMVESARERARAVHASLVSHLDSDRDVVVVEPSDLTMFRDDYERLLPERSFERLRDASYDVLEYVYGLLENGADAEALPGPRGDGSLAYHAHCQQRTLGLERYTEAVLEDLGYDLVTSDVECCGMAGSFGYKREYYELSVDVGEHLVETFDTAGRTVVASGTSCGEQLEHLTDREAAHPVELLDPGR